ncbi:SIMPL domain-containing protein [Faecalibacter bovis]|uniref:SIMPL domain-containing protein n=1 Tax=Faecalibacter bovis TaxID=2898187 RepID=A0ABX7XBU3_9FLAO|nr:SIMPL domain-containing protein [Faecalibacter bovis]QTV05368.1 SIMPL domain-containing protein [Faecalibacter bovis]
MNKTSLIVATIAAIALVTATLIIGNAYKYKFNSNENINVTGNALKDFDADLVKWRATYSRNNFDLKTASDQLKQDQIVVKNFLISQGIKANEIVFEAVNITKDIQYGTDVNGNSISHFNGYILSQDVTIESKDLDKIEKASREISNLISQGIELNSSNPNYYYSKLEDLKLELIAQASENAKQRAENIATKAGSNLGELKKADLGIFQITGKNDNEVYSYGGSFNTTSRQKTAQITVKTSFGTK